MAIKVLIDDRYRHRGTEYVSINPKLSRLLLYKQGYEIVRKNYGQDVDFVQILTDLDRPNFFWLKPCDSEAPGMRKFDKTSKYTRTLSIRALLKELKCKPIGTVRLRLEWDDVEKAARIDISQVEEEKK